jgi:opacity protein-like surface antigen
MKKILALSLLLPAAALAQKAPAKPAEAPAAERSSRGRFLIAPKVGLFEATSRLAGAVFLGLEAGYITPALDNRLAVTLELDWVRPRTSGTSTDPRLGGQAGTYSLFNAEVGLLLSAVYRMEDLIPRLTPYGGLGPGLYFHRAATTAFGSQYIESEARVGLQALAGADYTLGPGAGFAEFRYHFTRVDFLSTGNANLGGFLALSAGYRFRF